MKDMVKNNPSLQLAARMREEAREINTGLGDYQDKVASMGFLASLKFRFFEETPLERGQRKAQDRAQKIGRKASDIYHAGIGNG